MFLSRVLDEPKLRSGKTCVDCFKMIVDERGFAEVSLNEGAPEGSAIHTKMEMRLENRQRAR